MGVQGGTIKKERHSGIELLRILAGMAVVVLHFNYLPGGHGAMDGATGFNAVFLMAAETLCICAVNVFILISGYFGSIASRAKTGKLAGILLQTMVFGGAAYLIKCLIRGTQIAPGILGRAFVPVNYFIILYVVMMLLSPFLNKLIAQMKEGAFTRLAILLFLLFSVTVTGVDMAAERTGDPLAGLSPVGLNGSMNGYSIVHFIVMYMIGAWLRVHPAKERPWKVIAAVTVPVMMAGIYLWDSVLPKTAWMYCNPLVIIEAVVLFRAFESMRFRSRIINTIAPASLTCFLIQEHLLGCLNFDVIRTLHPVLLFGVLLAAAAGIYLAAFALMKLWNLLIRPVLKLLDRLPDITCG